MPSEGNQPRLTEKTRVRMIAATKDGSAAEMALVTITDVSIQPGFNPPSKPRPTPRTTMMSDE